MIAARFGHLAGLPISLGLCGPADALAPWTSLLQHAQVVRFSPALAADPIALRDEAAEVCLRNKTPFHLFVVGPGAAALQGMGAGAAALQGMGAGAAALQGMGAGAAALELLHHVFPGGAVVIVEPSPDRQREALEHLSREPAEPHRWWAVADDHEARAAGLLVVRRAPPCLALPPAEFDRAVAAQMPAVGPCWAPLMDRLAHTQARLVLITPCSRPRNLAAVRALLRPHQARIAAWFVVHDADPAGPLPDNDREDGLPRLEREHHMAHRTPGSTAGNAQRNHALGIVERTAAFDDDYLYFVDDDSVVHPALWDLPLEPGSRHLVCVDAYDVHAAHGLFRKMPRRMNPGHTPRVCRIDTAQAAVAVRLWKDAGAPGWILHEYCADGVFIEGLAQFCAARPGAGTFRYVPEIMALSNYQKRE
jgi:hypothetical protein